MNQLECYECTDYLESPDFEGELVCPICYKNCRRKMLSALDVLEKLKDFTLGAEIDADIKKVFAMRSY